MADPGKLGAWRLPVPDTMTPAQAWLVALADSWLDEMVLAQVMSLVLRHDLEPRLYRKRG